MVPWNDQFRSQVEKALAKIGDQLEIFTHCVGLPNSRLILLVQFATSPEIEDLRLYRVNPPSHPLKRGV